jgi:TetR/AcrR family transcriptional regulator
MLFYYFKSKKELYYFIVDYGIDYIQTEYLDQIDDTITDFIQRYKAMSQLKIEAYSKNPEVFNFFGTLYMNSDMIYSGELEQKLLETRKSGYQKLFDNIDKTLFREDIDPDEGIRLVRYSMDGYEKELLSALQGKKLSTLNMDPYWEDFYRFLDLLEKILYK